MRVYKYVVFPELSLIKDGSTVNVLKFQCFSLPVFKEVIMAGIPKPFVRIANREDPDQTASSDAV